MTKKKVASGVVREISWVEGHKDPAQPVFWSQLKKGKLGDRELTRRTDRRSTFVPPKTDKPKHPKAVQERLSKAARAVIATIQKIADGEVLYFTYTLEPQHLRYQQKTIFDGESQVESRETDDETLLEEAGLFAEIVIDEVATVAKPLTIPVTSE